MIDGSILVAGEFRRSEETFRAFNAANGLPFGVLFCESSEADVADACLRACGAFDSFASLSPDRRAAFLKAIASELIALGDQLIETAMDESGLPRARLEGERTRTVNQLIMFAGEVRDGAWLDVAIDKALPDRSPPRPDLRRMDVPLGPVAVFGASNFPLAFSVAGGDTASAFAAGCTVVVKGHPAHPGTGELAARAIQAAVTSCGLDSGIFSYLPSTRNAVGAALVSDPRIKAVGFTGSRQAGLALLELARRRLEPIPVYAEMSSINPVVLMPHALEARAENLAADYFASLTLGAGQFCTNPGLVLAVDGDGLDRFLRAAGAAVAASEPMVMLSRGIEAAYVARVAARESIPGAHRVATGRSAGGTGGAPILHATTADGFADAPELAEEIFGYAGLIVRCADLEALQSTIAALEGQLTATIHFDSQDAGDAAAVIRKLSKRAGRVLANGWPTGVEVSRAMVHGGPFPATSDSRTTSVGTLAMKRFLRPVCFQDLPAALMPAPLRDDNPWSIPQTVS